MKKVFSFSNFILALIFVTAFFILITSAMRDSVTTDEHIHLFSGYTYLTKHDFRLDPEHPPFIKEMAALPLLFFKNLNIQLGDLWQQAGPFTYDSWKEARLLSDQFLYSWGNNAQQLIFWGRLPVILLTLILGLAVYLWAKKLYGEKAGIFGSFLILFMPSIIAHGRLINTDLGLTLFLFLAVYFWVQYLKSPKWLSFIFSGLFLGLTLASKYTGMLLLPILLILLVVSFLYHNEKYLKKIFALFGVILIAAIVIWATYGFSLDTNVVSFKTFSLNILIPYWWKGLNMVFIHATNGHGSFLMGQTSGTGWWYYFPMAIWFKTPVPFFILIILSLIYYRRLHPNKFEEAAILIAPILYLAISMYSKADLGVRHVLPIFPFLAVFASPTINLANFKDGLRKMILGVLIIVLILWYSLTSIISFPNYLAYFSDIVGGSKNGYQYLTDSNLDWGQDIYRIKNYVDKNQIENYELFYPWLPQSGYSYYGIKNIPVDSSSKLPKIVSVTYLNWDFFDWIKKYPFKEITPGVFIYFPN